MKNIITLLLMTLMLKSVEAGNSNHRQWLGVFGKKSISENSHIWQEFQLRYNAEQGKMQQTLFRFGYLKELKGGHEWGGILGYIQSDNKKELRPTLQHTYTDILASEYVYNFRYRLEYRLLEKNSNESVRYRLLSGIRRPIGANQSILIWDEFFINLTKEQWSGERIFERNRLFLGLRMDREYGRWEFGYLNQYVPRTSNITQEHTLVVYFFY